MTSIRGFFNKVWVLLWKGVIFRFRFYFTSLLEIFIPLLIPLIFLAAKGLGSATPPDYEPEKIPDPTIPSLNGYKVNLFYTPQNDFTINLMSKIAQPNYVIVPASNEDDLLSRIESLHSNTTSKIAGIVFLGEAKAGASKVSALEYKLRTFSNNWNTKDTQPHQFYPGPSFSNPYPYFDSGFAALHLVINNAFISLNSKEKYVLEIQEFPYPKYLLDISSVVNDVFVSILFLGFIILGSRLSHNILLEKQSGIKELQKMNGISSSFLWFGWYINSLIIYLPVIIIMTILLCGWLVEAGPIIEYSDPFVIFITLFLFLSAAVTFIFFITTWFTRPMIGMIVVILLWSILSNVKLTILWSDNSYLNALFFIKAIQMAFTLVLNFESRSVGIKWSNLTDNVNGVSMLGIWLMFILDIFIGAVLTWYIDQLKPGKFGVARSWYFPFEKLVVKLRHRIGHLDPLTENDHEERSLDFEPVPLELEPGIEISQIRKVFGKKVAVDRVNLTIYKNEITVLLGHNGAGKTTLMSMITGLYSPTEGVIRIDGKNVSNELDIIRKSIGLCPQDNMHFPEFTVYEHLLLFSMIKGNSRKEACEEANDLLKLLNIEMKRNDLAKTLSGGMKRKLSLGIALIGHAKVVILDEPTSGMDPQSRRAIWDHLLRIRGQRTILITTHFMEEADVLGDRIAIMAQGRVRCFGTSMFLKSKFGSGYQLKMLYNKPDQLDEISGLVKSQVPGAKLETSYRTLLTYSLPITSTPQFPELFQMLDNQKKSLGINSIGVAVSTLEDVFLSLDKDKESKLEDKNEHSIDLIDSSKFQYTRLGGSSLLFQRTKALLVKKLLYTWRRWYLLVVEIVIPILVILYAMYLSSREDEEPELAISLGLYPKSQILIETNNKEWESAYSGFIKQSDSTFVPTTNINQSLLKIGYKDIIDYREHYLIASKSQKNIITAMYSTLGLHTIPATINMASNVILEILTGSKDFSIKTINHPIRDSNNVLYNSGSSAPMTWMMIVPLGLTLILAVVAQFPLIERLSNSKQVQFMAGVSPVLYWTITFLIDFLIYLFVVGLMLATIAIYDQGENFTSHEYVALFVLLFLYGLSSIWLTNLITFFVNTVGGALNTLFTLNILTGLIFSIIILLLDPWPRLEDVLHHLFLFCPQYSFSQALLKMFSLVYINSKCRNTDVTLRKNFCLTQPTWDCCACNDDECSLLYPYFNPKKISGHEAVWEELWYFIADFFILILIVALIESGILKRLQAKIVHSLFGKPLPSDATLDEDVFAEKKLTHEELNGQLSTSNMQVTCDDVSNGSSNITSTTRNISMLLANDLVKQYGCSLLAVKGVSFRVGRGECFGLLGVNGAGKTTTFKILTAEEAPTQGEAKLDGYLLSRHWNQYMSRIGYCPQFDPINEVLTGRETLTFYAQIRGKHPEQVTYEVDQWIDLLGLDIYQNALCGTYSGGNKRKLSTAIALIAKPDIVFLDEPTSGVDPVSRRNLWNVVEMTKREGKSLVLTSHSMEECEALCDRLAIMVAGQMKCLGPNQYLKEKFGKGYNIQLKMASTAINDSIQEVKIRFENIFKGCQLLDEHKTLLQYEVTNPSITLSILFRAMEDLKANFKYILEDYSVSQTTLEQIFLSFAQQAENASETTKKWYNCCK